MFEILTRLVLFTFAATTVSYGSYLFAASAIDSRSSSLGGPVMVRDELRAGEHQLSGMVMVPTSCHELSVDTATISRTDYALVFKTWREPSVTCSDDEVPRAFHTVLFAPAANVNITATLDGSGLPLIVLPIVAGHKE